MTKKSNKKAPGEHSKNTGDQRLSQADLYKKSVQGEEIRNGVTEIRREKYGAPQLRKSEKEKGSEGAESVDTGVFGFLVFALVVAISSYAGYRMLQ